MIYINNKKTKIFLAVILNSILIFSLQFISVALPKNNEVEDMANNRQSYNLNIKYVRWDYEQEPFPGYFKKGKNKITKDEEVKIPTIVQEVDVSSGEGIVTRRVTGINYYTENIEVADYINSKIVSRSSSFKMPSCDLNLCIVFD